MLGHADDRRLERHFAVVVGRLARHGAGQLRDLCVAAVERTRSTHRRTRLKVFDEAALEADKEDLALAWTPTTSSHSDANAVVAAHRA